MSETEKAKDQETAPAAETAAPKKRGLCRRILKWFCVLVGLLVTLVVLAVVTTPLWLGPTVKSAANRLAPKYTGCDFNLEELSINPFSGKLFLRECHLKNPKGYKSDEAFAVSTVVVEVAVGSLFSKEVTVRNVEIRGLRASYLSDGDGVNNFDRIAAAASGKEPGQKPTEEEKAAREAAKKEAEARAAEARARGEEPAKVVVDKLEISDTKVEIGLIRGMPPAPLAIPTISLKDIGKDKGGVTFGEVARLVFETGVNAIGSAGSGLKALGGLFGDGAKGLAGALGDGAKGLAGLVGAEGAAEAAVGAVTNTVGAAAGAVGDAVGAVGETAGKAADAAADVAGKAVGAVGDAAGAVGDTAGKAAGAAADAAGKAAGAVGDAAGKAAESLGNLFKSKKK